MHHTAPSLDSVLELLLAERLTHVVGLPDSVSAPLLERLQAGGVRVVSVTREGEAFAIAAGLWLGGARPLVLIQNTGLLESGDALRGTAQRMGAPVVVMVTCRGYASLPAARDPDDYLDDGSLLVRPDLDTAALFTEPALRAWGVPTFICESDDALPVVPAAFAAARQQRRPAALLITRGWSGA